MIIVYQEPLANAKKSLLPSPISTPLEILNSIRRNKEQYNFKTSGFKSYYSNLYYQCTLSNQSYPYIHITPINVNYPLNKILCHNYFHSNYPSSQANQHSNGRFLCHKTSKINNISLHTDLNTQMRISTSLVTISLPLLWSPMQYYIASIPRFKMIAGVFPSP